MKKGDKIIWDSGCGYDLGYVIVPDFNSSVYVLLATGRYCGNATVYPKKEIFKYSKKKYQEVCLKYNYNLEFCLSKKKVFELEEKLIAKFL